MIVGVLSDTNDRFDVMATAVRVLADAGAELIVHCGDIGNRKVLDSKTVDVRIVREVVIEN